MHIKVGTRGSKLALWQTNYVISILQKANPSHTFEVVEIRTKGDKFQDISLQKIGDKGLFVKEIEEQLLQHQIDFAVHSMKDMPSILPEGLCFSKTFLREDARDVLILREKEQLTDYEHPRIGTGSLRRNVQIKKLFPHAVIKDIRGNVETRIRKLDEGEYDAIVMAAAGLKRLGLQHRISRYFTLDEIIPASAQGALAIELRIQDSHLLDMINACSDALSHECVKIERAFLASMDGNCHVPVGAYCEKKNDEYYLHAIYGEDLQHVHTFFGSGKDAKQLLDQAIHSVKKEMDT